MKQMFSRYKLISNWCLKKDPLLFLLKGNIVGFLLGVTFGRGARG